MAARALLQRKDPLQSQHSPAHQLFSVDVFLDPLLLEVFNVNIGLTVFSDRERIYSGGNRINSPPRMNMGREGQAP